MCRERILRLKKWRVDNGFTIDQCVERCGEYPSEWSVRKFFAKGSEDKPSFKESTVAAIELALLGEVYSNATVLIEDMARSIEDAVKPYAREIRLLRYTVERQAHIINGLFKLCAVAVTFFAGIALYDFFTKSTGFWGTHSSGVWIAKVVFLACTAAVVVERFYALHKLKVHYREEIQQQKDSV